MSTNNIVFARKINYFSGWKKARQDNWMEDNEIKEEEEKNEEDNEGGGGEKEE